MSILPAAAITNTVSNNESSTTTRKRVFVFDFDKGEFVLDLMKRVRSTTDGREVLEQIVSKALHDDRYKYPIYSKNRGNEVKTLLAQDYSQDILESELRRVYREALIYIPQVEDVSGFSFERDGNDLYVSFTVTGVDGIKLQWEEVLIL